MTSGRSAAGGREWIALLACGTRLSYESRTFTPSVGELVPCRQHGYCRAARVECERTQPSTSSSRARARPRTQRELVEYVRRSSGRTLSTLRRHRFTLRMVHNAAQSGAVVIDDRGGHILIQAGD